MGNCISGQRNSTPPTQPDLPDNRPFADLPEPQQAASQRPRPSINSRLSGLPASDLPNNTIPRSYSEQLRPRSNSADANQQQHPSSYSGLSELQAQRASVGSRNSSDAGATFGSDDSNLTYDNTNVSRLSSLDSLDSKLLGGYQYGHPVATARDALLRSPDERIPNAAASVDSENSLNGRSQDTAATVGSRDSNDDV
jgi:hypothetical protein